MHPPRLLALTFAVVLAGTCHAQAPPTELADYVKKPDRSFAWKLRGKAEAGGGIVYDLTLVSQTWQGIDWDHGLQVFVPKGARPQATMVLWNQGGTPSASSRVFGAALAEKMKAPVAFLYGVPKQPLFDGKKEDALIAETFVRYLESGDPSWPLLFPMVKSVVRAMDALQAFAKDEWKFDVTRFVVTGASKRGWTSWLTAASGDPRVKAIAPMVIDTLNFPAQMKNQVAAFGRPSEMIRDYTERKLVPIPDTPAGAKLWRMVDPWVYRDAVTVPKMVINGANDPYWPLDALNSYWDDLKGEKYLLYVPNAGHDLREVGENGMKAVFAERAVNTLSAFARAQVFGTAMPKMEWVCDEAAGVCRLTVNSPAKVKAARVWRAESPTRDFRPARWSAEEQKPGAGPATATAPATGFAAFFAEYEYELDDLAFTLCTQIRILEAKK